jgi:hypothetical protein
MVQVDLPAAFAVGQIYALLSREYLKKEPARLTHRLMGPLNFFLSCCFAPVGLFLLIGWPAWEVMYVTNWVEEPYDKPLVAGFYVLFGVVMVLLGNLGFALAHGWYRQGKDRWVMYGAGAGLFLTILPFLLKWGIWMRVGTYEEIRSGSGYSFWEAPFFNGWAVIMAYLCVTTALMGLWFRYKGSRLEP